MVVRFYILQTHYRSTLDFSNEALQASERALRRLWEAYEVLKQLTSAGAAGAKNTELDAQVITWCRECDGFMKPTFLSSLP